MEFVTADNRSMARIDIDTPLFAIKSYEDGKREYILADDSRLLTREEMAEYKRAHPGEIEGLIARGIPFKPNYKEN